jgi:signal transduction histidine kinase
LGLATVQRLVEQHGGSIQVRSRPGEGTCFRVSLACVESA